MRQVDDAETTLIDFITPVITSWRMPSTIWRGSGQDIDIPVYDSFRLPRRLRPGGLRLLPEGGPAPSCGRRASARRLPINTSGGHLSESTCRAGIAGRVRAAIARRGRPSLSRGCRHVQYVSDVVGRFLPIIYGVAWMGEHPRTFQPHDEALLGEHRCRRGRLPQMQGLRDVCAIRRAPCCPKCLSVEADWVPVSGRATLLDDLSFANTCRPISITVHGDRRPLRKGPMMISSMTRPKASVPSRSTALSMTHAGNHPDGYRIPPLHRARDPR